MQKCRESGFTAVEVTVSTVMLALIASFAIVSAGSLQKTALARKGTAGLFQINMAKMAWMMDHPGQDLPADESDRQNALVNGHYLKYGMPICPYAGTYTVNSVYSKPECSLNGSVYDIDVPGKPITENGYYDLYRSD